ncbi:GNAT family N-acetyltransferase [Nocardia mangyaensis]|uniref:GNAT family N-acetyltransferase n=1 Tax=Nocardia mangyaensis TaxID=2213200 RepID=A0A1J0VT76_9NOCA|nr:GNAT family N-acetyltransferase [Nocardia mangyaensis]APE35251.1 GNAT family N-acetyltransferase [Nocardia mangyaensis]
MTSAKSVTVRSATEQDRPAIAALQETGFGMRYGDDERALHHQLWPVERALVAVDNGRVVGHTTDITMTVTVPGQHTVRAAGVSGVAVAPTHRRRGILRELYTAQHERTESDGLPLTVFTASEATIYGRFGYDTAILDTAITIDRRRAEFRPSTPDPGGVELATLAESASHIEEVYGRWQRQVPGAQARPAAKWGMVFADVERHRDGATSLFVLVHPDGYALYRRRYRDHRSIVSVVELRAATQQAHLALWRVLLSIDLVDSVEAEISDDDPLPYLLTDSRAVRVTRRGDSLWARVMDVPAALTARAYRHDLDTVLAVHDPFRSAGGEFALRVRDGVAECEPTTRPAELVFDINVLGALYFGAHRARVLAAAHRIRVEDVPALRAFDEAFTTDRMPELGWFF